MSFTPWTPSPEQLLPAKLKFEQIKALSSQGLPVSHVLIEEGLLAINSISSSVIPRYGYLKGESSRTIDGEPGNCIAFAEAHVTILDKLGIEKKGLAWDVKFGHASAVALIAGYLVSVEPKEVFNEIINPGMGKIEEKSISPKLFVRGLKKSTEYPIFDIYERKDGFQLRKHLPKSLFMPELVQARSQANTLIRVYTNKELMRFLPRIV